MTRWQCLTVSIATILAVSARAAAPDAAGTSESVTARADGKVTCATRGVAFDQLEQADGTTAPFDVPAGKAFLLADAELQVEGTPGHSIYVALESAPATSDKPLADKTGTVEDSGLMTKGFVFKDQVTVGSGGGVCVVAVDVTAGLRPVPVHGVLHGALARVQ